MTSASSSRALSVVVPTFERRRALERLLLALEDQTLTPERFEAVVAVDGSTDGTCDALESYDPPYRLRWLWQANRGRASACNAAIRRAEGDLVVILDDDMEPTRGLLQAHQDAHPAGSRRCVMGAVPVSVDDAAAPHVRYVAEKFDLHLARLARPEHPFQIRDFYSGNTSVRRADLLRVGLFDDRFREYGNEDLELAHRLVEAGVELGFSAHAIAHQHYDKSIASLVRDERSKGRTAAFFAAKHPEALPGLKITALRTQPARRRAVRGALLSATRAFGRTPDVVLALLPLSRALGLRSADVALRFVLEYFYMLGVEQELRRPALGSDGGAR